ncbi:MAG: hypothetical protein LLF83_02515 [Methanobacterium sp.]|nr:hypothetical protein [Methanobacterium sp.]
MGMEWDELKKKYDKLLEEGEIVPLWKLRKYQGIFTDKAVKLDPDGKMGSIDSFSEGDKVLVIHWEDYVKWYLGMHHVMDIVREDRKRE